MPRILTIALAAIFACVNLALPVAAGGEFIHPAQVADLCKYANDGECDEPHKCAPGTDGDDCKSGDDSCKYANDGECDEPKDCALGTDATDCAQTKLRGTPPPTNTQTEVALKTCGVWNGRLNPSAVMNTKGNETKLSKVVKCRMLHNSWHLNFAIVMNDLASVRWLLANGAEVNARVDDSYETPLHHAARVNSHEVAEFLLQSGADVNAKDKSGSTPFRDAAFNNAREVAELLLRKNAEVNAKNRSGSAPLHYAALGNAREVAELLLQNDAEVNSKNNDGWTPLYLAARKNARKVAELLLQKGADVNAKNNNDWTPLDRAILEKHIEMQSLLRRHGGRCNKKC